MAEVLQGFGRERDVDAARAGLLSLTVFDMVGVDLARLSAQHHQTLRRAGLTVSKRIHVLIATFCLVNDHELLFSDRDFVPMVAQLGLRSA